MDLEEKTHEQCAQQMDISRSTVQEIYERTQKIAACLVTDENCALRAAITAFAADRESTRCGQCCRNSETLPTPKNASKGERIMKLAVTYENGQIFQHFGRTAQFKLYDIEDGKIVRSEVVDTNGSGHGALAGFLIQRGVDTLICGGIGGGAQSALANAGIRLFGCVSGDADAAAEALVNGTMNFNPCRALRPSWARAHGEGPYLRRTRLRLTAFPATEPRGFHCNL